MRKLISIFISLFFFNFFVFSEFDFSKIKNNVIEFTLENGLKFILLEDHSVPIATFVTYANVGGSDERIGIYGISHFIEHMAFKGTSEIGTNNPKAEKKTMAKMDSLFNLILTEKDKLNPDTGKIKKLGQELNKLKEEATKYIIPNDFDALVKRHGGVGLNAGTSEDCTMYFMSLPSNKLELWAYMESSRYLDPVFREFHKERDVIKEERRTVVENNPVGKLIREELLAIGFKVHPYGDSTIGPMSNLEHISRSDMRSYFKANYTARNMVVGVAGDIYPAQLKKITKKYFSKLTSGKRNPGIFTVEPRQLGEKTITIYEDSQPWLVLGYHIPSIRHKDFTAFQVLDNILTKGRSSSLYKKMVTQDKSALFIGSMAGFPGNKYPSLFVIYTLPNKDHTTTELKETILKEIENLKKTLIPESELKSAKKRMKVSFIKQMKSKSGLLMGMLTSEVLLGSWQKTFDQYLEIEKVTPRDIQKLAEKYLTINNRVVARIEKKGEVKK